MMTWWFCGGGQAKWGSQVCLQTEGDEREDSWNIDLKLLASLWPWRTAKTPLQNQLKVISGEGLSCLMHAHIITWKRTPSARFGCPDEGTKTRAFRAPPTEPGGNTRENMCPQTWSGASSSNEQYDHLENTLKKVP